MAKAKAKTTAVKKSPEKAKNPVLKHHVEKQSSSARIAFLLFGFLLLLTIGTLLYQKSITPSGKEILASTLSSSSAAPQFDDISPEDKKNHDFMAAVSFLAQKGIVLGYGDNKLKPLNPVNRAEFLKMLTIALKKDITGFGKPCFSDVKGDEWFAPYVCYAKDAGWIKGFQDGKVLPGNQISLAEAVKIIVTAEQWSIENTEGMSLPTSKKIVQTAWYIPYIKVAFSKFILYYYKADNLDPAMLLSRRDVILILFSGILVDTIKTPAYSPSDIPKLFSQEGIPLTGEASLNSAPSTPEAKGKG